MAQFHQWRCFAPEQIAPEALDVGPGAATDKAGKVVFAIGIGKRDDRFAQPRLAGLSCRMR